MRKIQISVRSFLDSKFLLFASFPTFLLFLLTGELELLLFPTVYIIQFMLLDTLLKRGEVTHRLSLTLLRLQCPSRHLEFCLWRLFFSGLAAQPSALTALHCQLRLLPHLLLDLLFPQLLGSLLNGCKIDITRAKGTIDEHHLFNRKVRDQ